ncbi:hypothetical protein [Pseudooceanicola sp. MF1-13]|uniref:hypothetical protein n=1 Tax=Pseudooceanicola sp. MF1-13 TaxID=3379095 RepID=UPI003891BA66
MKKLTLALFAAALMTTSAQAGSYADPVIEAPVIVEDTTSSSSGELLVLYLASLVVIAAMQ